MSEAVLPYLFDNRPGIWALSKFLESGRLFEVGAYSRLSAYSNKYGILLDLALLILIFDGVTVKNGNSYIQLTSQPRMAVLLGPLPAKAFAHLRPLWLVCSSD